MSQHYRPEFWFIPIGIVVGLFVVMGLIFLWIGWLDERDWRRNHDSGITVRSIVATGRATDKTERDRFLGWGIAMLVRLPRWLRRLLPDLRVYLTRTDEMPSVDILILALELTPEQVQQCYHVYRDKPRERLPEIWFEALGVWLKEDGSQYNGDYAREYIYPGAWDRWRLRRSIRRWQKEAGK